MRQKNSYIIITTKNTPVENLKKLVLLDHRDINSLVFRILILNQNQSYILINMLLVI